MTAFYNESEAVYSRRGILPLQIEVQLKIVRMLIAFNGYKSKSRVNTLLTRILEQWTKLKSETDRMSIVVEVAKV